MNFTDTFKSVELVLKAGEVPLLVGETGIGKTSLARELAAKNDWSLVGIDGNLLKEGKSAACLRSKRARRFTPFTINSAKSTKKSPRARRSSCSSTKSTAATTPSSRN